MPVLAPSMPYTAAPVFRSLVLTSSHVPIRSSTCTTTWAVAKVAPGRVRARSTAAKNQRAFVISTLLSFALDVSGPSWPSERHHRGDVGDVAAACETV